MLRRTRRLFAPAFARLRPRSAYDVMAAIACFGVLAGGTAYAANTIGSSDIINESILSEDIKNGEVKNSELAGDSVGTNKIAPGNVTTSDIAANSVTAAKIPNDAGGSDNVNATRIDGLDGGHLVQALNGGVVRRDREVLDPNFGISTGLDGGFSLQYNCPASPANDGTALINNNSGETVTVFKDDGSTDPDVEVVSQGDSASQTTNAAGDAVTFQLARPSGYVATVWMFTVHRGTDCLFEYVSLTTP